MHKLTSKTRFVFLLGVMILAIPYTAAALSISYTLNFEFSGSTTPGGTLTATFDDSFGDANTVRLTMQNNLVGTEFTSGWYFNFDPALTATGLTFNPISNTSGTVPSIMTGTNAFKADGVGGFFDILFDFPPPGSGRFEGGESVIYDLVFASAITANSFNFGALDSGLFSAAHVQSIGPTGDDSGWIAPSGVVPEPATLLLLGSGLLAAGGVKRSRERKRKNTG